MILLIDNYDSFTYNLYQLLGEAGAKVAVVRNDELTADALAALDLAGLVISPGPGRPEAAGISVAAVRLFAGRVPVLGVCLGHQAIAIAYGASVGRAPEPRHGKASAISHDGQGIFTGLPAALRATRYHSLAVDEASLPAELFVSARSEEGVVMGIRHRTYDVEGVQFHPESCLTEGGRKMLATFARRCEG